MLALDAMHPIQDQHAGEKGSDWDRVLQVGGAELPGARPIRKQTSIAIILAKCNTRRWPNVTTWIRFK